MRLNKVILLFLIAVLIAGCGKQRQNGIKSGTVANAIVKEANPELTPSPSPIPNMKDLPALTESAAKNGQECKCEQVAERGFTIVRISCIPQSVIFLLVAIFMVITCKNDVFSNDWNTTRLEKAFLF